MDTRTPYGRTGKTPWLTLGGGEKLFDSQLIIQTLNK
jgi:hypothetical protein